MGKDGGRQKKRGDWEGYAGGVALASTPDEEGRGRKKKVLARLKKLCRPLKTIRLMKYVKAHKETLRPFKGVRRGAGGAGSWENSPSQHLQEGEREKKREKTRTSPVNTH